MDNYYRVLGLSSVEDNPNSILAAYRERTAALTEKARSKVDVTDQLILLNEAYLVLSDVTLKAKYDSALSSSQIDDEELKRELEQKRSKAKDFVLSQLAAMSRKKKKSRWPAIVCGFFIALGVFGLIGTCAQAVVKTAPAPSQEEGSFSPGEDWETFEISNSFSLSIPATMELAHDYDEYTKRARNKNSVSNSDAIFQQKGLSSLSPESFDTYCRVIVRHAKLSHGEEVERHNQTTVITYDDRKAFRELVDAEAQPESCVGEPTYEWIDIAGTKAIRVSYKRTGKHGLVTCRLYLLPNYDEIVKIVTAYRDSDAGRWQADMNNVIRTFKWNNPK